MSSRSRDTVAWVATTPVSASSSTSCCLARDVSGLEQRRDAVLALLLGEAHLVGPLGEATTSAPRAAARRLAACSNTALRGPSITSASTSSPRIAGRQCRKMASASAASNNDGCDVEALEIAAALVRLGLLTHRDPDVGVDRVRALDGVERPVRDGHEAVVGGDAVHVELRRARTRRAPRPRSRCRCRPPPMRVNAPRC